MTDTGMLAPPSGAPGAAEAPDFGPDDCPTPTGDDPTANASALTLRGRVEREIRQEVVQADEAHEPVRAYDAPPEAPDSMAVPTALTEPSPRRRSPFQYVLDRDRHELYVRVRYTTAIVAGFSLLVLVGFSYVTGRHLGRGPSAASAGGSPSAEEIASGPVEKGVFDLAPRSASASGGTAATAGASGAGVAPGGAFSNQGQRQPAAARVTQTPSVPLLAAQSQPRAAGPAGPAIEPNPGPPKNVNRTLNLQYVIVQSYPEKEKPMADEACEYLTRAGIPCTVEKGVVGYTTADWYCVVGTTPFEKASGPIYAKYLEDIEKVNQQYAGKSRFKRFTPQATRWRGLRAGG
jgi:hypothetical protein